MFIFQVFLEDRLYFLLQVGNGGFYFIEIKLNYIVQYIYCSYYIGDINSVLQIRKIIHRTDSVLGILIFSTQFNLTKP